MKKIKILLTAAVLLLLTTLQPTHVQTEKSLNAGVDLMSRYIWRGMNLGGSVPSIQPSIEYNIGGFAIGTWGAFGLSDGIVTQETDLFLSYTFRDVITLTLTDYFLPIDTLTSNNYFEFKEDKTGHLLEGALLFKGTEKIPFTFLAAVNFWGADALKADGKKQFSTYFEVGYNGTFQDTEYNIFAGFTTNNPDEEQFETGYYGEKAGLINLGLTVAKEIKVTDTFSLPFTSSFIINPMTENVFLVVGISF